MKASLELPLSNLFTFIKIVFSSITSLSDALRTILSRMQRKPCDYSLKNQMFHLHQISALLFSPFKTSYWATERSNHVISVKIWGADKTSSFIMIQHNQAVSTPTPLTITTVIIIKLKQTTSQNNKEAKATYKCQMQSFIFTKHFTQDILFKRGFDPLIIFS